MTQAPADWYPDPLNPAFYRYWDGSQWTENRSPAPSSWRPRFQFRDSRALGIATIALTSASTLGSVVLEILAWPALSSYDGASPWDAPSSSAWYDIVSLPFLPIELACWIWWCLWMWRVRRNAEALNPRANHARSDYWIWLVAFVPIVQLWFPYRLMRDIYDATPSRQGRGRLLGWWWAAYVGSIALGTLAGLFAWSPTWATMICVSALIEVGALVGWIKIVRAIEANQAAWHQAAQVAQSAGV